VRIEGGWEEKGGGGAVGVWADSWMVIIRDYGSLVGDDEAAEKEASTVCDQDERGR